MNKAVEHDAELVILVEDFVARELLKEVHCIVDREHIAVLEADSLELIVDEPVIAVEGTQNVVNDVIEVDHGVVDSLEVLEEALDLSEGDFPLVVTIKAVENVCGSSLCHRVIQVPDCLGELFIG